MGRTDCPARMDYERALVELARFHRERNGALSECRLKCAQNILDIADIVREGIYQHSSNLIRPRAHAGQH